MSAQDAIVAEMYDLTPAQVAVYNRLHVLVEDALEQFDQGFAVNVEDQMAELARQLTQAKRFYQVSEVAEILGVSPMSLYRAIQAGELPTVKVPGMRRYVIPAAVLDQLETEAFKGGST